MSEQLPYNPLGLFGFYSGDVPVVIGSGLGGASLTNCAVVLETEAEVFRQAAWPDELREQICVRTTRWPGACWTRRPRPRNVHAQAEESSGTAAKLKAERRWDAEAYRAPLAITFASRTNAQGMRQHGCVQCGDCATGCNVGAKSSLDMNYLPLAWTDGAVMFTQVEVSTIRKTGELYQVDYVLRPDSPAPAARRAGRRGPGRRRRRDDGHQRDPLAFPGRGPHRRVPVARQGFSGNGNYLGFIDYQYTHPEVQTHTAGVGIDYGAPANPVGAYIEGAIDFRRPGRPLDRRVVIEDMARRARWPAAWRC